MNNQIKDGVGLLLHYININEMDLALQALDHLETALTKQAIENAIRL